MQQYRVFKIGLDGHVFDRVDLTCSDDDDAKKQAMALVEDHDIELWQLDKRIATYKAHT
jgi:predicted dinucleotide-binding enzyme